MSKSQEKELLPKSYYITAANTCFAVNTIIILIAWFHGAIASLSLLILFVGPISSAIIGLLGMLTSLIFPIVEKKFSEKCEKPSDSAMQTSILIFTIFHTILFESGILLFRDNFFIPAALPIAIINTVLSVIIYTSMVKAATNKSTKTSIPDKKLQITNTIQHKYTITTLPYIKYYMAFFPAFIIINAISIIESTISLLPVDNYAEYTAFCLVVVLICAMHIFSATLYPVILGLLLKFLHSKNKQENITYLILFIVYMPLAIFSGGHKWYMILLQLLLFVHIIYKIKKLPIFKPLDQTLSDNK